MNVAGMLPLKPGFLLRHAKCSAIIGVWSLEKRGSGMKRRKRSLIATAGALGMTAAMLASCGPSNPAGEVYGPPPDTPAGSGFDPGSNYAEPVYGPPPDLLLPVDPEDNIPEDVYGPPEFFEIDPGENIAPEVYGPPPFG